MYKLETQLLQILFLKVARVIHLEREGDYEPPLRARRDLAS